MKDGFEIMLKVKMFYDVCMNEMMINLVGLKLF